jgi:hypothetical protein
MRVEIAEASSDCASRNVLKIVRARASCGESMGKACVKTVFEGCEPTTIKQRESKMKLITLRKEK